jgi:hypothetical protein
MGKGFGGGKTKAAPTAGTSIGSLVFLPFHQTKEHERRHGGDEHRFKISPIVPSLVLLLRP